MLRIPRVMRTIRFIPSPGNTKRAGGRTPDSEVFSEKYIYVMIFCVFPVRLLLKIVQNAIL
jgi:hypothetical protein